MYHQISYEKPVIVSAEGIATIDWHDSAPRLDSVPHVSMLSSAPAGGMESHALNFLKSGPADGMGARVDALAAIFGLYMKRDLTIIWRDADGLLCIRGGGGMPIRQEDDVDVMAYLYGNPALGKILAVVAFQTVDQLVDDIRSICTARHPQQKFSFIERMAIRASLRVSENEFL